MVYLQTRVGPLKPQVYRDQFPDQPLYEMDTRLVDENGHTFTLVVGGDKVIDSTWGSDMAAGEKAVSSDPAVVAMYFAMGRDAGAAFAALNRPRAGGPRLPPGQRDAGGRRRSARERSSRSPTRRWPAALKPQAPSARSTASATTTSRASCTASASTSASATTAPSGAGTETTTSRTARGAGPTTSWPATTARARTRAASRTRACRTAAARPTSFRRQNTLAAMWSERAPPAATRCTPRATAARPTTTGTPLRATSATTTRPSSFSRSTTRRATTATATRASATDRISATSTAATATRAAAARAAQQLLGRLSFPLDHLTGSVAALRISNSLYSEPCARGSPSSSRCSSWSAVSCALGVRFPDADRRRGRPRRERAGHRGGLLRLSPMLAGFDAPDGGTACETSYNAYAAIDEAAKKTGMHVPWTTLPERSASSRGAPRSRSRSRIASSRGTPRTTTPSAIRSCRGTRSATPCGQEVSEPAAPRRSCWRRRRSASWPSCASRSVTCPWSTCRSTTPWCRSCCTTTTRRYDFGRRYTFDFVGRPYATVYWLGCGARPRDAARGRDADRRGHVHGGAARGGLRAARR